MLKKSEEINNNETIKNQAELDIRRSVLNRAEEMLVILKNNEAMTKELLKSVRFIKNYYFWQSAFNILKILVLAGVVILGIISWDSIMEFINMGMSSYISTKVPSTIDSATINTFFR